MDHRYLNQSLTRLGVVVVVPRQRPALAQPSKRPLYHPPSRQQHKTLGRVAPLHNLQYPPARRADPGDQLPRVAAIGPDQLQLREQILGLAQHQLRPIAVLNIGRVNDHAQQQTQRIDQDYDACCP